MVVLDGFFAMLASRDDRHGIDGSFPAPFINTVPESFMDF
jgi:hypothetical protein